MPKILCSEEESDSFVPQPSVIKISSTWKKVFKNPLAGYNRYHNNIQCRRCGKRIKDYTWFYAKTTGGRNKKKTVYYCEPCYDSLWLEL